jgi:hypothetical protein
VPPRQRATHPAVLDPGLFAYVPGGHRLHAPAPPRLYCPTGHTTAVALEDAAGQKYPAVQLPEQVGVGEAGELPYTPGGQSLHATAPVRLYRPRGHGEAVATVEPLGQVKPALQFPVQAVEFRPWLEPYRPAGHRVHAPAPPRLYCPTTHMAAVALGDPATQA